MMQAVARRFLLSCGGGRGKAKLRFKTPGKARNFTMRFHMWRRRKVDNYGLSIEDQNDGISLADYESIFVTQDKANKSIILFSLQEDVESTLVDMVVNNEQVPLADLQQEVDINRKARLEKQDKSSSLESDLDLTIPSNLFEED